MSLCVSTCTNVRSTNDRLENDYAFKLRYDHQSVGRARMMNETSFCTFAGFAIALNSESFAKLRGEWARGCEDAAKPPSPPPPPAQQPRVVVGVPVEVAFAPPPPPPQRPNDVVEMDESDDEEEVKAQPPPPPPSPAPPPVLLRGHARQHVYRRPLPGRLRAHARRPLGASHPRRPPSTSPPRLPFFRGHVGEELLVI